MPIIKKPGIAGEIEITSKDLHAFCIILIDIENYFQGKPLFNDIIMCAQSLKHSNTSVNLGRLTRAMDVSSLDPYYVKNRDDERKNRQIVNRGLTALTDPNNFQQFTAFLDMFFPMAAAVVTPPPPVRTSPLPSQPQQVVVPRVQEVEEENQDFEVTNTAEQLISQPLGYIPLEEDIANENLFIYRGLGFDLNTITAAFKEAKPHIEIIDFMLFDQVVRNTRVANQEDIGFLKLIMNDYGPKKANAQRDFDADEVARAPMRPRVSNLMHDEDEEVIWGGRASASQIRLNQTLPHRVAFFEEEYQPTEEDIANQNLAIYRGLGFDLNTITAALNAARPDIDIEYFDRLNQVVHNIRVVDEADIELLKFVMNMYGPIKANAQRAFYADEGARAPILPRVSNLIHDEDEDEYQPTTEDIANQNLAAYNASDLNIDIIRNVLTLQNHLDPVVVVSLMEVVNNDRVIAPQDLAYFTEIMRLHGNNEEELQRYAQHEQEMNQDHDRLFDEIYDDEEQDMYVGGFQVDPNFHDNEPTLTALGVNIDTLTVVLESPDSHIDPTLVVSLLDVLKNKRVASDEDCENLMDIMKSVTDNDVIRQPDQPRVVANNDNRQQGQPGHGGMNLTNVGMLALGATGATLLFSRYPRMTALAGLAAAAVYLNQQPTVPPRNRG